MEDSIDLFAIFDGAVAEDDDELFWEPLRPAIDAEALFDWVGVLFEFRVWVVEDFCGFAERDAVPLIVDSRFFGVPLISSHLLLLNTDRFHYRLKSRDYPSQKRIISTFNIDCTTALLFCPLKTGD